MNALRFSRARYCYCVQLYFGRAELQTKLQMTSRKRSSTDAAAHAQHAAQARASAQASRGAQAAASAASAASAAALDAAQQSVPAERGPGMQ